MFSPRLFIQEQLQFTFIPRGRSLPQCPRSAPLWSERMAPDTKLAAAHGATPLVSWVILLALLSRLFSSFGFQQLWYFWARFSFNSSYLRLFRFLKLKNMSFTKSGEILAITSLFFQHWSLFSLSGTEIIIVL